MKNKIQIYRLSIVTMISTGSTFLILSLLDINTQASEWMQILAKSCIYLSAISMFLSILGVLMVLKHNRTNQEHDNRNNNPSVPPIDGSTFQKQHPISCHNSLSEDAIDTIDTEGGDDYNEI